MRSQWPIWTIVAAFFVVDLGLKWLAFNQKTVLSFGPLKFELFLNTGIVFSLPVPKWIYLPIATAVLITFIYALLINIRRQNENVTGLLFLILGAASNLRDNLIHGATIDYLIFFGCSAVNLADLMIVIGVILLIRARGKKKLIG
ncbi:hypothetical protein A2480_03435 [Candidatus Uhrbacteria bacterium RIFOXYC2_FULL_47_19]|uniref:Uncharacterized protein n=1 Tax=Candidatus Uhrbacteria bacterium RIFOXYC2_FULL_47_19 TaxID=1802424 RepID=A0A1F7WD45_9BACT|nr:MAG: hypothetical protein A2480_03435 [Candidatus Uhrbacteria bacterium RIFOXYC2_FULL_47_19]HCC22525.1 hypothetical protein [Candidatus Uhrbacteria bacterium]